MTNEGKTALDWANENEYNEIIAYLGGSTSSPTIPVRENNNQNQDNNTNYYEYGLPIYKKKRDLTKKWWIFGD